ncbi:hypothetical protein [Ekhidna sp.]
MKAISPTIVLLFLSFLTFGQDALNEGNRILGGGMTFNHREAEKDSPYNLISNIYNDEQTNKFFSFSPYYGRLYKDDVMVGLRLNIATRNNLNIDEDEFDIRRNEFKSNSIGVGGFLRRYYRSNDNFGLFLESGIDFTRYTSKSESTRTIFDDSQGDRHEVFGEESNEVSVDARVGLYYFLFSKLSIETNLLRVSVSYRHQNFERRDIRNDEFTKGEGNVSTAGLNLVNQFTFDKIFTLNYYF